MESPAGDVRHAEALHEVGLIALLTPWRLSGTNVGNAFRGGHSEHRKAGARLA